MLAEPIAVTLLVADVLEALDVPYAIGGSLASAFHGVMRATMDVDLVADLRLEHAQPLAQALGDTFYADVEVMRDAIRRQASFNVIHLETMFNEQPPEIPPLHPRPTHRPLLSLRARHVALDARTMA